MRKLFRGRAFNRAVAAAFGANAIEPLESRVLLSASLMGDAFSYPIGNFSDTGLSLNGASITDQTYGGRLGLTTGIANQANSAFSQTAFNIAAFTTDFSFQITNPSSGGFSFTVQNSGAAATGAQGGVGDGGIASSASVEFHTDNGQSTSDLLVNGVVVGSTNLASSGVNFFSGHVFDVEIAYDGSTMSVTETDAATPTPTVPVTATQTYTGVNLANAVVGSTAYVGFTGATGSTSPASTEEILSWELADQPPTGGDIGSPSTPGTATYSNLSYTITGGGSGIGGTSDQFNFLSQSLVGDSTTIAELNYQNGSSGDAAGIMLRDGTAAGAAYALLSVSGGTATISSRASAGASSIVDGTASVGGGSVWLELVRDGSTISGYTSTTGAAGTYSLVGTMLGAMSNTLQAGLAVTAGGNSSANTANFSDVSIHMNTPVGVDLGNAGQGSITTPDTSQMWVDVIKDASAFTTPTGKTVALDANGYPLADFETTVFTIQSTDTGVYHLEMTVAQNPTISLNTGTITNQVYNPATQQLTANLNLTIAGNSLTMKVTNTNGGASNIHLIRPGYSTTNPPTFTTAYINYLKELDPQTLRLMSFLNTNNNPTGTWASRTSPAQPQQDLNAEMYNYDGSDAGYSSRTGIAWEYAIEIANMVHSDLWVNIPAHADNNYLTQLANLIKYGDTVDGVTYPGLSPDLNVYIEFSNETWNPGFNAYTWDEQAATAEVVADAAAGTPSNLNYDNLSLAETNGSYANASTWGLRYFARRVLQTGQIFAGVFGPGTLNTRIRPVLSTITTSESNNLLNFVQATYGTPSNYFYALATVVYMNQDGPGNSTNTANGGFNNPNLTTTDILQNFAANATDPTLVFTNYEATAQQWGLKFDAYEGGFDFSGSENIAIRAQAERLPQMANILELNLQRFYSEGGNVFDFFNANAAPNGNPVGDYQLTEDVTNPTGPKVDGFVDARFGERTTAIVATPDSLAAVVLSNTSVQLSWNDHSTQVMSVIQASTDPNFAANLISREIYGPSVEAYDFTGLQPGIHYYFRVMAAGYSGYSYASSSANATTSGVATVPAAPSNLQATALSQSQIGLTWTDNANTETGFYIDYSTDPTFATNLHTVTVRADSTSYTLQAIDSGTTWYLRVRAFNPAGSSANSNAATAATPALTPIAAYNFGQDSGSTVYDSTSNPANGTIVGGVTQITGSDGALDGLNFDGATGEVNLGNPSKLNLTGQMTVSAWIKPTSVPVEVDLIDKDYDNTNTPFFLQLENSTTVIFGTFRSLPFASFEAVGTSPTPLTDGNWHHVAGVYNGSDFEVFIDGVLRGSFADNYGVTTGFRNVALGRSSNGGEPAGYYDGGMADVQFFNTGLGADDIAKLAGLSQATTPNLSISGATANQTGAATNEVFTVTLSQASTQTVTIAYATADGTATVSDGDYTAQTGTLTFAPGVLTQTISVALPGDPRYQPNKSFTVQLSSPSNANIAVATGTATIVNQDAPPAITANDASITDVTSGSTHLVFTVGLSGATEETASVSYSTSDGTATLAAGNYTTSTGTLTFAPGVTSQTVSVWIAPEPSAGPNLTLFLNLSAPSNATIGRATATGTIINPVATTPTLSIAPVTQSETTSGTSTFVFPVTLSSSSSQTVTVAYATADGTATVAHGDYVAASGTLTFSPGVTTQNVSVTVNGTLAYDPSKIFYVNLSSPANATITTAQAAGTITSTNAPPKLSIGSITMQEAASGTTAFVFPVTLTGATELPASVSFATADGSATIAAGNYVAASGVLTFAPGVTTQNITVTVNSNIVGGTKYFYVNLSSPTNAAITAAQGTGTINVAPPSLGIFTAAGDIGSPVQSGTSGYSGGTYTVAGAGFDIWNTSDQFQYAYTTLSGNGTITAEVTSQTAPNPSAKAGVMVRNTLAANSAEAMAELTPGYGALFEWRSTAGATTSQTPVGTGPLAPYWVRLNRTGNTFTAYRSPDGVNWTELGSQTISMNSQVYIGLAVCGHNSGLSTATFSNVSVAAAQPPTLVNPASAGNSIVTGTSDTLSVLGGDPVSQTNLTYTWAATGTVPAPVSFSVNGTNAAQNTTVTFAKAGVYTLTATITNASGLSITSSVTVTVNQSLTVISVTPGSSTVAAGYTEQFTASANDQFGIALATQPAFLWAVTGGGTVSASGLFAAGANSGGPFSLTASAGGITGSASVSVLGASANLFTSSQDVGSPAASGYNSFSGGVYSVTGAGTDMWNGSDQFHYVYTTLAGDGVITARVVSQTGVNAAAKAGVMFRNTLAASSVEVMADLTPADGATFQWRSTAGGPTSQTQALSISTPYWVRISRAGNTFTAYRSVDGINWVETGSPQTIVMNTTIYVGLAVSGHNSGLNTATFDNVSIASGAYLPPPVGIFSGAEDIGSPALSGAASYAGGVYSVSGAGSDIFNQSDQFQFVYETLSGNGSITAQVLAQTANHPAAKAGIMIRNTLDPASAEAMAVITPSYGAQFQYRTAVGATTAQTPLGTGPITPYWLRLTRTGNTFTAFSSPNGVNWTQIGTQTISMNSVVYVGLAVSGHGAGVSTGTFGNVSVV